MWGDAIMQDTKRPNHTGSLNEIPFVRLCGEQVQSG